MNTYQIDIVDQNQEAVETSTHFIKTNAPSEAVDNAISFVPKGEKYIERLLQALRLQSYKASEIKVEPVDIFEVR